MTPILLSSLIAFLLPPLVFLLAWILAARSSQDREKFSPFECGFDPKSSARIPFSLRFFLLAVIFLIFDIEIALIIPLPIILNSYIYSFSSLISALVFILILLLGLLHEWREGSLNWTS